VVTRDGVPLGYEVFAGNRADVTTVEEIVTTMERRYGQARRVWVMHRGVACAENITWLRASQRRYLIGASKSELKTQQFARPPASRDDDPTRAPNDRPALARAGHCLRGRRERTNRRNARSDQHIAFPDAARRSRAWRPM
jgi:Transposase DDE domain